MKKLLTLVAGYAAGLAVAMKYRKNAGKSKLSTDSSKSKIDGFIEEVVDIHKSAYGDAKEYVETNLEDLKDFDTLKTKVTTKMTGLADEAETLLTALKTRGKAEKAELEEDIEEGVEAITEKKEKVIRDAKNAGSSLSDIAVDTIVGWIDTAKSKIEGAHKTIKSELDTDTPARKTAAKKPVAKKKPAAPKSPKA